MTYRIEIVPLEKDAPLSPEDFLAIVGSSPQFAQLPRAVGQGLRVKRAGGLEATLHWDPDRNTIYTTQPETDVVAAMIELAAMLGGRVRGENFESYTTPFETYEHPDDSNAIAEAKASLAKLNRGMRWQGGFWKWVIPTVVVLLIFGLNCPWFWPKPEVFPNTPPEQQISTLENAQVNQRAEVIFAPLEDFDFRFVAMLARQVNAVTGLSIRVAVPVTTKPIEPYPGTTQYDAIRIAASLDEEILLLRADYGNAMIIFFTNRDINQGDASTRFVFAFHDYSKRLTVISSHRLVQGTGLAYASQETIRNRILKFSLRSIAEHHYALPRSKDRKSLMYSPIRNLMDVDRIGFRMDLSENKAEDVH